MRFIPYSILILLALTLVTVYLYQTANTPHRSVTLPSPDPKPDTNPSAIRFIPMGDSYTIGMGVKEADRWPNRLVSNLRSKGIDIRLLANPAVSGFTVKEAIAYELPVVKKLKPDLVTVCIGANDSFMLRDPDLFEKDYRQLLSQLEENMSEPKHIILINLPDYTKAPVSGLYKINPKYQELIRQYNAIITTISLEKGYPLVDLYPLSQTMTRKEDYIADGLHPSALGYQKWETAIFPVVWEVIKERM
jgi:lysophospholipase L1-like esterase